MKKKDIIALVVALAVIVGAGYLYLNQNKPASAKTAAQAEVVPVLDSKLDSDDTLGKLSDTYKVRDYKQVIDHSHDTPNTAPFAH